MPMIALSVLPLACIFFLSELLKALNYKAGNRGTLLYAILNTGVYCVLTTEILSYYHAINFTAIMLSWAIPAIALGIYCLGKDHIRHSIQETYVATFSVVNQHRLPALVISSFLFISLFIAIAYPPNNFDSMTYHLARVAHWQQNQSIAHYQTYITRQLVYPPYAEWIILHLQVLTGGDRLANVVQLFFFAGSMITVSLIVKELGGSRQKQIFGALFTCFIPMAIIQSNTTQNDIVAGFFVSAFVYLCIRLIRNPSTLLILMSGAALGLAWLTKGTAIMYTCLFCTWIIIPFSREFQKPLKQILGKLCWYSLIFVLAFFINSGQFYRNNFLTGSYLGKASEGTVNEGLSLKSIAMVGIKDFLNHVPANASITHTARKLAVSWKVDVNDPKYNLTTIDWMMDKLSFHEDYAQNFFHTLLFILALVLFFFNKQIYNKPPDIKFLFIGTLCATWLLFVVLLKWQPWANRLQTSLYFLIAALLAIQLPMHKKWFRAISFTALLATAIPSLLLSARHPLLPFKKSIFSNEYNSFIYHGGMLDCKKYIDSMAFKKLGLVIDKDSWDYPFFKLYSNLRLKHVLVNNESNIYLDNFAPDAILSLYRGKQKYILNEITYYRTRNFENGGPAVFEPRMDDQARP